MVARFPVADTVRGLTRLTSVAILANNVSRAIGHREEHPWTRNPHYRKPGLMTRKILNPTVALLTRPGVSVWGSRVLEVRGRTSGDPRRTPVNLLELDGVQYLVSARGNGQWVRNLRADDGRLALLLGRRRDERTAQEVPDAEKSPVLRAYLRKWKSEVGIFFDGVTAASEESELRADRLQAPGVPSLPQSAEWRSSDGDRRPGYRRRQSLLDGEVPRPDLPPARTARATEIVATARRILEDEGVHRPDHAAHRRRHGHPGAVALQALLRENRRSRRH